MIRLGRRPFWEPLFEVVERDQAAESFERESPETTGGGEGETPTISEEGAAAIQRTIDLQTQIIAEIPDVPGLREIRAKWMSDLAILQGSEIRPDRPGGGPPLAETI